MGTDKTETKPEPECFTMTATRWRDGWAWRVVHAPAGNGERRNRRNRQGYEVSLARAYDAAKEAAGEM